MRGGLLIGAFLILGQGLTAQQRTVSPIKSTSSISSPQEKNTSKRDYEIVWEGIRSYRALDDRVVKQISCRDCRQRGSDYFPYKTIYLDDLRSTDVIVRLKNIIVEDLSSDESRRLVGIEIPNDFETRTLVKQSAGEKIGAVSIDLIRKNGSSFERLVAFDLDVQESEYVNRGSRGGHSWKDNSVLASGEWLRMATGEDGIYKVTYEDLAKRMGGLTETSTGNIRLFTTPAGMLPMDNDEERPDDLEPVSIDIEDGGDGVFGPGDHFLFYGEDQATWRLTQDRFVHALNPFADSNYYFLNVTGIGSAARVISQNGSLAATRSSTTYDFYDYHEEDLNNLIKSGRTWYGEALGTVSELDFGFTVPNIDKNASVWMRSGWAARSIGLSGVRMRMSLPNQGGVETSASVSPVADFYGALYADDGTLILSTAPKDGDLLTKIQLDNASNPLAQAWIDYIELNARRTIRFLPPFMSFRDKNSVGNGEVTEFTIQSDEAISVWDVSDQSNIQRMNLSGGVVNGFIFTQNTDELREFVCFNEAALKKPRFSSLVPNQDLHALADIEYIIVAHRSFLAQAERLANLHAGIDGMSTLVVTPEQIYNEFSGGIQDISAIKEFLRMLYFEADSLGGLPPKYLLLFGDASYDYKDRVSGNSNFVPTHQMRNSLSPTGSIASDDFYGLLDDDEGESQYDFLDIGIGRLPARSRKEAEDMVNKIVGYSNTTSSFGEWRNDVAFVADDADPGDRFTFMRDFESLGTLIDEGSPEFVVRKIYMDSYKQVVGSGGERYPEGADGISERVDKGALMMYYIGHGGELGWGHERFLEVPTINKWDNFPQLPLFVTATCEFARFDDPRRTSGGEYTILNPSGGGIALLTTTRAVYANPNLILSTEFTRSAFENVIDYSPRLGDVMLETKVRTLDTNATAALNSRSFALLGDPALRLAYPELNVQITEAPDTIRALEKVKISGIVTDQNGVQFNDFNGVLYPSVYDKEVDLQTLDNDGSGNFDYSEWKNLVFKGKVSVKDGQFSFEFVVPKDINRAFGPGRINLYAQDSDRDAHGDFRSFIIGGISSDPIEDSEGPAVELFMNNDKFIFGGLTDENPDLYAEVSDDNGINMVGSGVGHDITAVLDENTSNTIILNDYYEATIDSYTEGTIRFPFNSLEEGRHTLKLQVWDVNNNPGTDYTEFVVASSEELALEHVLNYPNPFTTHTDFFFEHNKPGQQLDVSIDVFTVSGKQVKSIEGNFFSDGYRVGPIAWNGKDEYGDQLAKGVYLYKVSVKTIQGESVEKFERLVLLK